MVWVLTGIGAAVVVTCFMVWLVTSLRHDLLEARVRGVAWRARALAVAAAAATFSANAGSVIGQLRRHYGLGKPGRLWADWLDHRRNVMLARMLDGERRTEIGDYGQCDGSDEEGAGGKRADDVAGDGGTRGAATDAGSGA